MARRRTRGQRRSGRRGAGMGSNLLWTLALVVMLALVGAGGWGVFHVLSSRQSFDEATLCPKDGPPGVVAVLLDLTDPLDAPQAARLRALLDGAVAEAPTYSLISLGVVSADPADWGAQFTFCKPATGAEANPIYENPRLIAERFETGFHEPLEARVDAMMRGTAQDSSPIMEALQALLAETPFALDGDRPLKVVLVSDMLQHSDVLSFYRGEGWDAFEASGGAARLSHNLGGARIELIRIARPGAPEAALAQVDGFWSRYLDRQGAAVPIQEVRLGGL